MAISYPNSTAPVAGLDVITTATASTTAATILPANPARALEGYIVNNATKNLWVSFNASPATAAPPSTKIPALGGSMDIPGGYIGAVSGIWETGAAGNCNIHEFSYV